MYCEKCATELPDTAIFCSSCGKPTSQAAAGKPKLEISRAVVAALLALVIVLLVFVALLILQRNRGATAAAPQQIANAPLFTPYPQGTPLAAVPAPLPLMVPRQEKLFSGTIGVNARSMNWVNFTITSQMGNIHVTGHFQVSGGHGNDIQAAICSEQNFINFRNGHPTQTFYNSGKITVADIDATLPNVPGKYVLVFNNAFSLLAGKMINGDATISYEAPRG